MRLAPSLLSCRRRCGCASLPPFSSLFYPSELLDVDFGEPLHSLVICGTTHPLEDELLKWHRAPVPEADRPAAGVPADGADVVDATPDIVEAAEAGEKETPW